MNIQTTVTKLLPFTNITLPKSAQFVANKFVSDTKEIEVQGHTLFDNDDIGQGNKFTVTGTGSYNGRVFTVVSKALDENFNTIVKVKETIASDSVQTAFLAFNYNELNPDIKESINSFKLSAMASLEGAFLKESELFNEAAYTGIERAILSYFIAALVIQVKAVENMEAAGSGSGVGSAAGYGGSSSTPAGQIIKRAKSSDSEVEFENLAAYSSSGGGSASGAGSFTAFLTDSTGAMIRRYMRLANDMLVEHYHYPIDTFADTMNGIDGALWKPFLDSNPVVVRAAKEEDFNILK